MNRTTGFLFVLMGVILLFAVGLVGYYMFSAQGEDGLEKTMSENNVTEGEPTHDAPLSYGQSYFTSFLSGILGFGLTLLAMFLVLKGLAAISVKNKGKTLKSKSGKEQNSR